MSLLTQTPVFGDLTAEFPVVGVHVFLVLFAGAFAFLAVPGEGAPVAALVAVDDDGDG
ncbi:hypothetical protein [Cryobacterium luteum]|uniref:hypothetical protein n=1 Tax=Cryobacterium luteum TaxID=1424661 RepID=UPI00141B6EF3|nr:hypothetical protein [Cryobacterium luteum]